MSLFSKKIRIDKLTPNKYYNYEIKITYLDCANKFGIN